jgi:hypothetical protein
MNQLLKTKELVIKSVHHYCDNYLIDRNKWVSNLCEIITIGASALSGYSVQECIEDFSIPVSATCSKYRNELVCSFSFAFHPPMLCIELWQRPYVLDSFLYIKVGSLHQQYKLYGVIYFSCDHFTSRVITKNEIIWYHNGLLTDSRLIYELVDISSIPMKESILTILSLWS